MRLYQRLHNKLGPLPHEEAFSLRTYDADFDVAGFDPGRYDYGTAGYPAQLALLDVRALDGSQVVSTEVAHVPDLALRFPTADCDIPQTVDSARRSPGRHAQNGGSRGRAEQRSNVL